MREKGAVLIETAITVILFLGLLGAIITFSIAAFRYTLLVDTTTTVSRRIAIDPFDNGSVSLCPNIIASFKERYERYLSDEFGTGFPNESISFSGTLTVSKPPTGCTSVLTVNASWEVPCFFCLLFRLPSAVSTQTIIPLENPDYLDYDCPAGCSSCGVGSYPW